MPHTLEAHIDTDVDTDEVLVERARQGDETAFAEIFRRHESMATRVARRMAPRDEVDDVVGEAFTSMLHQVRRGRGPREHVRAYLLACVRNEAMRRRRMQVHTQVTDDLGVLDRGVPFAHGVMDPVERAPLALALSALSLRQQDVLWAMEVEGYRPSDLAPRLGVAPNTVSAIAYRARRALRSAYQEPR
ncbi:RNA polymerase sigma factor [Aeromicrobium stalagmiti]|uniref:RNA polymerase sigma factor n=1 Tax=Aeromicrobium stalagmiti TaxID=2738988 RepID=UPI0015689A4E|nr:sigma-70 family RNA polymerase sigma factor [Aeromicrobium stalagmiti]NRQ50865.1 sigma-70 family RNA polymerase sigma factor [Aeromicrobium stalagmiti]